MNKENGFDVASAYQLKLLFAVTGQSEIMHNALIAILHANSLEQVKGIASEALTRQNAELGKRFLDKAEI